MPFYEYQCEACGHRLEALQKMSDDPLVYCPECNEAKLKKLISAAAFHLKGTGWYETDFKDKPRTDQKSDKTATKDTSTKSSSSDGDKPSTSNKAETKKTDSATSSAA